MVRLRKWAGPTGFVQVITVEWTKASRGGEGSRARNAIPPAFESSLEEFSGGADTLCVEVQHWSEHNSFSRPARIDRKSAPLSEKFALGCLTASRRADGQSGMQVQYVRDWACGGAPERWFLNGRSGTEGPATHAWLLGDGESVRISDNGRFSDYDSGQWWYQQVTVNAAWFDGEPDPRVFVDRKPTHETRVLADLW